MIQFLLKRSFEAILIHRKWLLLAFVPVIIYLAVSAAIPDRFVVRQEISISGETLVSLSPRAADLRSLQELISTPGLFFLNRFALSLLENRLDQRMLPIQNRTLKDSLINKVEQCLSLGMIGKNTLQIAYEGSDREQGEIMVPFYAQRLITQARDYLALNPSAVKKGAAAPRLIGRTTIVEKRALCRFSRLVPALYFFVITLIFLLIVIALMEWLKPSFRSERHVADYLKVPILGAFPDLKRIRRDG